MGIFSGWPWFWRRRTLLHAVLLPLSWLYSVGLFVHQLWRRRSVYYAGVPVVSIGNLTVGGSGKTPVVHHLAAHLAAQKQRVAIVMRGYGGATTQPTLVTAKHTAKDVGDEAVMLFQQLPGSVTIWVGLNRPAVVQAAEAHGADVLLLDDGFQRVDVHRNINILVFDGHAPFGNGFMLPAGPLRSPKSTVKRADFGIVIEAQDDNFLGVTAYRLMPSLDTQRLNTSQAYLAFCGIGQPEKFFRGLVQAGVQVAQRVSFPDHHAYATQDVTRLQALAQEHKLALVTTQKDAVKLPSPFLKQVQVVDYDLVGEDWENIYAELEARLA